MISMDEILQGRAKLEDLPPEVQSNLKTLLERINKIRTAYGKPMKVNDGYRRPIDQPKNAATASKHLIGAAIDIDDDKDGTFWKWVLANLQLVKDAGLWMEHPCWTHYVDATGDKSWMHFQILPPGSGKRLFVPNANPNPNPSFWDGKYDSKFN